MPTDTVDSFTNPLSILQESTTAMSQNNSNKSNEFVLFVRPDGTSEWQSETWCRHHGFTQVQKGVWSGHWYHLDAKNYACNDTHTEASTDTSTSPLSPPLIKRRARFCEQMTEEHSIINHCLPHHIERRKRQRLLAPDSKAMVSTNTTTENTMPVSPSSITPLTQHQFGCPCGCGRSFETLEDMDWHLQTTNSNSNSSIPHNSESHQHGVDAMDHSVQQTSTPGKKFLQRSFPAHLLVAPSPKSSQTDEHDLDMMKKHRLTSSQHHCGDTAMQEAQELLVGEPGQEADPYELERQLEQEAHQIQLQQKFMQRWLSVPNNKSPTTDPDQMQC